MKNGDFLPVLLGLCCVWSSPLWAACNANIVLTKPDSIYIDNFDGTVTDKETALTWAKCSVGQTWADNTANDGSDDQCTGSASTHTWKTALEQAQSANGVSLLGQTDWRLPNVRELKSLAETACYSPAINSSLFPSTVSNWYWTSSPYAADAYDAWFVHFEVGYESANVKNSNHYVRLVRGGN